MAHTWYSMRSRIFFLATSLVTTLEMLSRLTILFSPLKLFPQSARSARNVCTRVDSKSRTFLCLHCTVISPSSGVIRLFYSFQSWSRGWMKELSALRLKKVIRLFLFCSWDATYWIRSHSKILVLQCSLVVPEFDSSHSFALSHRTFSKALNLSNMTSIKRCTCSAYEVCIREIVELTMLYNVSLFIQHAEVSKNNLHINRIFLGFEKTLAIIKKPDVCWLLLNLLFHAEGKPKSILAMICIEHCSPFHPHCIDQMIRCFIA